MNPTPPTASGSSGSWSEEDVQRFATRYERYACDHGFSRIISGEVAEAAVRFALQSIPAPQGSWQPISTAPRDGTWFLAQGDGRGLSGDFENCTFVCTWEDDLGGYTGWQSVPGDYPAQPTHWMPLPNPPLGPEEE